MTKAIRIFAILAIVFEALYLLIGKLAGPYISYLLYAPGGRTLSMNEGAVAMYYLEALVEGALLMLVFLSIAILMIAVSNSKNEKIGLEIASYVVLEAVLPLLTFGTGMIFKLIESRTMGADLYGSVAILNSGAAYLGFIGSLASFSLLVSITMSLCRKKFVLPLEYELGIGVQED